MPKMKRKERAREISIAVGRENFFFSRKLFKGINKIASKVAKAKGIMMSLP
jgi:hypothetical protein